MELLRTLRFRPYLPGMGPTFALTVHDASTCSNVRADGRSTLAYRLTMTEPGARAVVVVEGADFYPAPHMSIDSDECVRDLLGFLTLREEDTDSETLFANDTEATKVYRAKYAETLSGEVSCRFDCHDCGGFSGGRKQCASCSRRLSRDGGPKPTGRRFKSTLSC